MAISASSVWEIRPAGNGANGSVFDLSLGGTDYTLQDAAQLTLTDGVTSNATTNFNSPTGGFTAAMVGNGIGVVQGGTYRGVWQITAFVDTNNVTVDRVGHANTVDSEFRVGGANLLSSSGFIFISNAVAGNKIWIKGPGADAGDYLLTVNSVTASVAGTATQPFTVEGYTTTRGDGGRPTLKWSNSAINCLTVTGNFNIIKNLVLDASTGGLFALGASAANAWYENLVCKNQVPCRVSTSGAQSFFRCRFTSSNNGDPGIQVQTGNNQFYECMFDNNSGHGVDLEDITWFHNCVFTANTLDGLNYAVGEDFGFHLRNCIVWLNGRDGVRIDSTAGSGGLANVAIHRCILGKNVGYEINYSVGDVSAQTGTIEWAGALLDCNAFYSTGSGAYHNLPENAGDVTLLVSPFESDTDFTLNSESGGGALVRAGSCEVEWADDVNTGSYSLGAFGVPPPEDIDLLSLWRELTNEKDDDVVPDSTVAVYLDGGLQALNRRVGFHYTTSATAITLVAGTQEYSLPDDCVEVVWVEWNGVRLEKMDVETWNRRQTDWRQSTGLPKYWSHEGDRIIFYPTPDAATVAADSTPTLRYVSVPASFLSAGAAQLNTQDQRIIVYFGVAEWAAAHPDSALAVQRLKSFMQLFDQEATGIAEYYRRRMLMR